MISLFAFLLLFMGLAACSSSSEEIDEEPAQLTVVIENGNRQSLILGQSIELKAEVNSSALPVTYSWEWEGKVLSTQSSCAFSPDRLGTHTVDLIVQNKVDEEIISVSIVVCEEKEYLKSIDDIGFWTGQGDNQSVLSIQWIASTDWENPSEGQVNLLSWGYRWPSSEKRTGYDMIVALAKADPRLVVVISEGFSGIDGYSIRGFGYDGNNDGQWEIVNQATGKKYQLSDFKDGVLDLSDGEDSGDGYTTVDPADYYCGGWHEVYASYYLGDSGKNLPSLYEYGSLMPNGRALESNSWDAWTFSPINSGMVNTQVFSQWMAGAPALNGKN